MTGISPSDIPVDEGLFRRALGRFATGVCVVTTRAQGFDHAMTANTFTSVSLDPPLVLVCVETDARFHDAVLDAGVWGVSVLDAGARALSQWFATRGRPLHGQFARTPYHRGARTGVLLLDDAVSWLECRTTTVVPGGDHSIVVGQVLGAAVAPRERGALVYYRSGYRSLE